MQNKKGAPHLLNPISHGSCENIQRVFHTLYPVLPISFACPKETGERKGHRCAGLVGRIPRTGFSPDAAVARVVSR